MKRLFLFRGNRPPPQVAIPDVAGGTGCRVCSDLVVQPAAALCSFPLAELDRERPPSLLLFFFFVVADDHINRLSVSICDASLSGQFGRKITNEDKHRQWKRCWKGEMERRDFKGPMLHPFSGI